MSDNGIPIACYDENGVKLDIGRVGDAAKVSQATLLAGEDQLNNVLRIEEQNGYELVAASQTAVVPGSGSGAVGDYLADVTVIASTGTTTVLDGATTVMVIPAAAAVGTVYTFNKVAKSAWKFTTQASTEVMCGGRFS